MSAPVEGTTVHDAISDLPPIDIGHDVDEASHLMPPQTEYQRFLRRNLLAEGEAEQATAAGRAASGLGALYNHITKQLNDITAERIKLVPTREQKSGTGPQDPKVPTSLSPSLFRLSVCPPSVLLLSVCLQLTLLLSKELGWQTQRGPPHRRTLGLARHPGHQVQRHRGTYAVS